MEIKALAEETAERAAEKTIAGAFKLLGVDINDTEQVNDLRADLVHMRRWRRLMEKGGSAALLAAIGAVTIGSLSFIWDAIKNAAKSHGG